MNKKFFLTVLLLAACAAINVFGADTKPAFTAKVSGHGKPLILIPGLSCSGEVWDNTVTRLQDRFECHVVTLAGFAGVPAQDKPEMANVRDGLAAYIRDKHLDKPALVGHSLGGVLALDLASHEPALVGRLVIVDAYPFFAGLQNPAATTEQAAAMATQIRAQMEATPKEQYEAMVRSGMYTRLMVHSDKDHDRIVAWGLNTDRHTAAAGFSYVMGGDLREGLAKIQSPSLVLAAWSAYKAYTNRERIEIGLHNQYAKLTGVRFAIHDEARHFIMYDEPEWFYAQVEGFLGEPLRKL